jgi:hypothetical protein
VKATKRRNRSAHRPSARALPIQAVYYLTHLARAMGVSHRRLLRVLKNEGAQVYRDGRFFLVPLTELEDKVPALWESLKVADSLRRALDVD